GGGGGPVHVRIAASNLSSGTHQNYDGGEGIRILQALHPDVAMMQEMNFTGDVRSLVDAAFGPDFSFFRQDGVSIPNGVVSRWPIVASGVWDDPHAPDRDFVWAHIDLPGARDLWAVSVHFVTSNGTNRADEAAILVQNLKQVVPANDFVAIAGDLN